MKMQTHEGSTGYNVPVKVPAVISGSKVLPHSEFNPWQL